MSAEAVRTPSSPNPVRTILSVVIALAKLTAGPGKPTLVRDMTKALTGVASPRRGDDWEELKLKTSKRGRRCNRGSLHGKLYDLRESALLICPASDSPDNVPTARIKPVQDSCRL